MDGWKIIPPHWSNLIIIKIFLQRGNLNFQKKQFFKNGDQWLWHKDKEGISWSSTYLLFHPYQGVGNNRFHLFFISFPTNCFWWSTIISRGWNIGMWTFITILPYSDWTDSWLLYKLWHGKDESRPSDTIRLRSFLFCYVSHQGNRSSASRKK